MTLTDAGRTLLQETPNLLRPGAAGAGAHPAGGPGFDWPFGCGAVRLGCAGRDSAHPGALSPGAPEVKIVLHNLTKDAQLQALRERRISVGFNRLVPQEADISVETSCASPWWWPWQPATRWRCAPRCACRIWACRSSSTQRALRGLAQEVTDAFRAEGVVPRVEQEVQDVVTAVALVSAGFGAAITTQSATNLRLPGVVFRPLHSARLKDLELSCLYRSGDLARLAGVLGRGARFQRRAGRAARARDDAL